MFTIDEYITAKQLGLRHAGKAASLRTLASYRWALERTEQLLEKPLYEVTADDAEDLMVCMARKDFAATTQAQILAACRGAFTWAIKTGRYGNEHPFDGILTPESKRELPLILTKEEIDRFFRSFRSARYRTFFQLMYYCGLRIGEVQTLRCHDLRSDTLRIRGKGEKERIVPIPAWLLSDVQTLAERKKPADYVFSGVSHNSAGTKITLTGAREAFTFAKERAGLPESFHPHNLRHTSATHLQKAVKDITITKNFLGHARVDTTMLYAQIADDDVKAGCHLVFGS